IIVVFRIALQQNAATANFKARNFDMPREQGHRVDAQSEIIDLRHLLTLAGKAFRVTGYELMCRDMRPWQTPSLPAPLHVQIALYGHRPLQRRRGLFLHPWAQQIPIEQGDDEDQYGK